MIKQRIKKQFNCTGQEKEFYLESLDEWLTLKELCALDGCELNVSALRGRIVSLQSNPEFKTLDGCVFSPKVKHKASTEHRRMISDINKRQQQLAFNNWLNVNRLFIPRDYEPRVMGSYPCK
ncbi:MAG: hypothetical protein GY694_15565 [Gammaproteobacteria bacterium]|nr:hypothetical protein [Gammaproteobacteria bacterium]